MVKANKTLQSVATGGGGGGGYGHMPPSPKKLLPKMISNYNGRNRSDHGKRIYIYTRC